MSKLLDNALSDQEALGDPSGNANAAYWDAWFNTVSKGEAFEWYLSSADLHSLLDHPSISLLEDSPTMLHAGTGNSDLVTALALTHDHRSAVAIDISPVAIDEMKAKLSSLEDPGGVYKDLEFRVQDVLEPPPTTDEARFAGVLDKGLIDAMMGADDEHTNASCAILFKNMAFCTSPSGKYIAVSLGEDHIVSLLLNVVNDSSIPFNSLDIHALSPSSSSSSLRPFAFVLSKSSSISLQFWSAPSTSSPFTAATLPSQLTESRAAFAAAKASTAPPAVRMSLVTLHIKPYEAEFDLLDLAQKIKQPDSSVNARFQFITHRSSSLVPVGFGISKLELVVVMREEDIDDLVEFVAEEFEDDVQSCDVGEIVPIASSSEIKNILQTK
jgi:translation elongation factor EF-1beta